MYSIRFQPRERKLLQLQFGLDDGRLGLEEVGQEFGVTREHSSNRS